MGGIYVEPIYATSYTGGLPLCIAHIVGQRTVNLAVVDYLVLRLIKFQGKGPCLFLRCKISCDHLIPPSAGVTAPARFVILFVSVLAVIVTADVKAIIRMQLLVFLHASQGFFLACKSVF